MDCTQVRELLSSFNDREATSEEKAAVEDHLRSCRECAFESTMIVGLKRLLGHWDGVRASQNFKADLMEKVQREPKRGPLSRVNWRPVGIGAAVIAGAAAVLIVMSLVMPGAERIETGEARTAVAPPGAPESEGGAVTPAGSGMGDGSGPVAQVLLQEGTLIIGRSGGADSLGSAGDVLAPGDSVKVSGKGEVELALHGGLRLRLISKEFDPGLPETAAAEFVIGHGPSEGELRSGASLLGGPADARGGEAYSVKTRAALVSFEKRDLLAEMALDADGSLALAVARGRAEVMLPAGVQILNAGQAMRVAPDGKLASPPGSAEKGLLERLWRWGKR